MQEARFAGRLKGNQSVQQAEAGDVSQKSLGGWAWGPGGLQGLGAGPPALGPDQHQFFVVLKSFVVGGRGRGGRRLKRLPRRLGPGGKRARDTPPTPPPTPRLCKAEEKRVFTLSVTETIQHAPQGRRITNLKANTKTTKNARGPVLKVVFLALPQVWLLFLALC